MTKTTDAPVADEPVVDAPATDSEAGELELPDEQPTQSLKSKDLLGIEPGSKDALGGDCVESVQAIVDDSQARVGHADFVNIGKAQRDGQLASRRILLDLIDLAADVSSGVADEGRKLPHHLLGQNCHSIITHNGIIGGLPADFY